LCPQRLEIARKFLNAKVAIVARVFYINYNVFIASLLSGRSSIRTKTDAPLALKKSLLSKVSDMKNTYDNIVKLISHGESDKVEFKTSFQKEVIESIVAFSNTNGGKVIIGVSDDNNIIGINISDESIQRWINQIKQSTIPQIIPDVKTIEIAEKNIAVFEVIEYPVKPVSYKNKYYKRIANSNHLMNPEEIANEHLRTINTSWDFYPDPNHTFEHISDNKIKQFIANIEKIKQKIIPFPV